MMEIGSLSQLNNSVQKPSASEKVEQERNGGPFAAAPKLDEKKVSPEEILTKIKDLTDGGMHSVRFEMDRASRELVVKIYNQEEELVRQVPSEELLGASRVLREYRGLLFDDKG
jgi:flagellar protein FlaG